MLSLKFYYRINYLIKREANFDVFLSYILDRFKHPFVQSYKKKHRKSHQSYLKNKRTTTDYFSINAYYWNHIINKHFKEFSYLEVGSWEGNSAIYILKNYKTKKVYCVDVWEKDKNYEELYTKNFKNFLLNMQEFVGRFSFFKDTSDNFFLKNKESFDIIYVDGTHEALQVERDINNSWKFLNLNGIMICDDYFYGNLYTGLNDDVPATSINKFLKENKNKLKILCVNNNQIFIKKTLN